MDVKMVAKKGTVACLLGYSVFLFLSSSGEYELVALMGALLGVIVRTLFPWVRKIGEGKLIPSFDAGYAVTALLSFIATGHFLQLLGEAVMKMVGVVYTFVTTFLFGMGLNSAFNEFKKWLFSDVFREENIAILRVIGFLTQPQVVERLKKLGFNVVIRKEKEEDAGRT